MNIAAIGATSAIVSETLRLMAHGNNFVLVGRDAEKLAKIAEDLGRAGAAKTEVMVRDLLEYGSHEATVSEIKVALGSVDLAIVGHGTLTDQTLVRAHAAAARREVEANFLSYVSILTPLANLLEAQSCGTLVVISSVAGDRGRQSNYVYGAAKAGVSAFTAGLRNRLAGSGVTVITIKPGFVKTKMTAGLSMGKLATTPEAVAGGIVRAIEKKSNVVYLPWFWWPIMLVIKHIPEVIFKKLNL